MKRNKSANRVRNFGISLAITGLILGGGLIWNGGIDAHVIGSRLLLPLMRLILFVSIGLVVGQAIETAGWTRQLAVVARPLFRFGNLGYRCGAAFTTAFFSGTAANAMLWDFYQEQAIGKKQLFLSNFVNQLPAYFLHLPTTMFIVIPLTGIAGCLYFAVTFSAVVLRTACFLIYGHFTLPKCGATENPDCTVESANVTEKKNSIFKGIAKRFPNRILGIVTYVIPIYTLVFVLNAAGVFTAMRDWMAMVVVTDIVPVESLSIVILSFVAEFSSGFAAAGALMDAGMITTKQTVMALLIGNIIAFPVRALRHQLPRYMGIFSPRLGTQILLMGQCFRIGSIFLVGVIFYLMA